MKAQTTHPIKVEIGEKIPIFPLPNSVLFPHAELPLYIFEPRYKQMLEDSIQGNSLLAIALLKKGWETHQEPLPCYDTVGIGYVKFSVQDQEGNFNMILKGIGPAKIVEYVQWEPYRIAKVNPLISNEEESQNISSQMRRLSKLFSEKSFRTRKMSEEDVHAIEKIIDPEELFGLAAHTANADFYTKQSLLETVNTGEKFDRLIKILEDELLKLKAKS